MIIITKDQLQTPDHFEQTELFDPEKYFKKIQRTSFIGQVIILVISLLLACGLFAQPSIKHDIVKPEENSATENETKFINFRTTAKGDQITSTWIVNLEKEECMYVLQKTKDGATYINVGVVKAMPTSSRLCYTVNDEKPMKGIWYYRAMKSTQGELISFSPLMCVLSKVERNDEVRDFTSNWTVKSAE